MLNEAKRGVMEPRMKQQRNRSRPLIGLWVGLMLQVLALEPNSTISTQALDAETIVERFIERMQSYPERRRLESYGYERLTLVEELDKSGEVTRRQTKEHSVTNLGGINLEQLTRIDGKPPDPKERRKELAREKENRKRFMTRSSSGTEEDSGEQDEAAWFDEAFLKTYQYILKGRDTVEGRPVYLLAFESLEKQDGGGLTDRVLGRLTGMLWVDVEEFEIVRMEVGLSESLTVVGGWVAALEKLDCRLERRRLEDGTWVNTELLGAIDGRRLWTSMRIRLKIQQQDIRLIARDTLEVMTKKKLP